MADLMLFVGVLCPGMGDGLGIIDFFFICQCSWSWGGEWSLND